jgi:cytochrome c biogenesis protein
MVKALPYVEKVRIQDPTKKEKDLQSSLKKWFKNWRRIETEKSITLFSEKGRFSRLGVPITHLSILIILIGGIIGSLYGFRGQVNILEGETVDQIFLRTKDKEIPKPIDFSVRCDDFNIAYYNLPGRKEKHVKEYTSVITILENGKEVLRKPSGQSSLHYKGLASSINYGAIHDILGFNEG